jgi:MoxR-like ATPase
VSADPALVETRERALRLLDEVERAVVGKRDVLELVLLGLLADGHVLLEDLPGLAKTLIARCFSQVLGLGFRRIQFTPDLLPADITGSFVYDQREARFEFRPGPLFTNLLLADEINRAPPKTQAALLEVMQEGQVSVEGETYRLEPPFLVIATENPIEYEGTYPLPEAQLDRFLLRIGVGYPAPDDEWEILRRRVERGADEVVLEQVVDGAGLLAMQASLEHVHVDESVGRYVVAIVGATREHPDALVGASPRGALALVKLARARAVLLGRDFVVPEDVKAAALPALAHRIVLRPELWVRQARAEDLVAGVLASVPTPPALDEGAVASAPPFSAGA